MLAPPPAGCSPRPQEDPLTSARANDAAGDLPSWRRLARTLKAKKLAPLPRSAVLRRFASAPAATLLVALVQFWAFPDPGIAPFVFMYVAPVLAAWFGGRLPGLLAVVLSAATGNFAFLDPRWEWATSGSALTATALFVVGSSVVALLCASFRDAVIRAEETARELQERHDETERAREQLRETETRYRVLFDSIDEGFCVVEVLFDDASKPVDYRFLVTNPAFVTQTGLVGAQGKRMRELAPLHEEHWFETYGRIALTGEPARFQGPAAQLHRWYDVYAFRSGKAEDHQVAILFTDITGRKESEAALREANRQLAEGDRRKDEFLAVLSHELRNPLAPIKNSLYVLERAAPGGEQARRAHAVIDRQVSHMTRLVSDFLDVSRIARGKIRLQCQRIDLREVVNRTLEDHRSVFVARGIELHDESTRAPSVGGRRCDPARPGAREPPAQLRQVHERGRRGLGGVAAGGRQTAVLRVRDTGVGIAPDMLERHLPGLHPGRPDAGPQHGWPRASGSRW